MFYEKLKYSLVFALIFICTNSAFTSDLSDKETQETCISAPKIDHEQLKAIHDKLFEGVKPKSQDSPDWREVRVTINKPVSLYLVFPDKPLQSGGKPLSIDYGHKLLFSDYITTSLKELQINYQDS